MPATTPRRLAAVLTAALVATLLAVTAGTASAAAGSAGPAAGSVLPDDHPALHPRITDRSDQGDQALDLAATMPGPDVRPLGVVADDRPDLTGTARGTDPALETSRGPPGR